MTISVVFSSIHGFVTDLGENIEYTNSLGEKRVLERYGVWKQVDRKNQVVGVTNDLEEAKRRALDGQLDPK